MAYELTEEIRVSVDNGCTVSTFKAGEHEELPEPAVVYAEAKKVLKSSAKKAAKPTKQAADE